ncbi:thioesterase family protein [Neisseria sp. Ec49-e6-T10]|uniref:thioesterase family protein n=1 Tax=Neisseria sp. Ec49-e6-T10 TaxID=3140744 RepID=UPI003EC05812
MSRRLSIDIPLTTLFTTQIPVCISDINYGQHLANDAVLRLAHETRLRFLHTLGYSETDIEGTGLIMTAAQIQYINQAFHADSLQITLSLTNQSKIGFDLIYHFFNQTRQEETARVLTSMAFFNYKTQKVSKAPERFFQQTDQLATSATIRCAALVELDKDNKQLLVVRVRDNPLWYLPGGKIEANETPKQALIRELKEELDIQLIDQSIHYLTTIHAPAYKEKAQLELICFTANWQGNITACAEISEVCPQPINHTHLFAPAVIQLIKEQCPFD